MEFTKHEMDTMALATRRIIAKKENSSILHKLAGITYPENDKIEDYIRLMLKNAIVIPLCRLYYTSHSSFETDAVERLASFLEYNTKDDNLIRTFLS